MPTLLELPACVLEMILALDFEAALEVGRTCKAAYIVVKAHLDTTSCINWFPRKGDVAGIVKLNRSLPLLEEVRAGSGSTYSMEWDERHPWHIELIERAIDLDDDVGRDVLIPLCASRNAPRPHHGLRPHDAQGRGHEPVLPHRHQGQDRPVPLLPARRQVRARRVGGVRHEVWRAVKDNHYRRVDKNEPLRDR